ncbi:TPA: glycosyltransferase family 2 protein [Escherichia coli]|nr:glycosyltransferase family 2 protein [Escherichia coli]
MPYVTIVMPAYNSEMYIAQAIESAINQTHTNFELLICDDGSTDGTTSIVSKYIVQDNRIKLLENINPKGAAGARNTCLDYAKGDFIAFLDSDDYWVEDKLEKQLNFMLENNIQFSYSNYYMFAERFQKKISCRKHNSFNSLTYTCDIGCLTVVLSKKAIGELRFPYVPKEDYAFWLMLLEQDLMAYNQGGYNAFYRKQKQSLSGNKLKEIVRQYIVLTNATNLSKCAIFYRLITYGYNAFIKHYVK